MKKFIALLIATMLCISLLVACSTAETYARSTWVDTGFTLIECKGAMDYVYNNETKVIYVFIQDNYQAGMAVLLNPDGTPMIYKGE